MMIIPGSAEYWQLFDGFQRSAYRLETLQYYQADSEAGPLRAFLAGQPQPRAAKQGQVGLPDTGRPGGR